MFYVRDFVSFGKPAMGIRPQVKVAKGNLTVKSIEAMGTRQMKVTFNVKDNIPALKKDTHGYVAVGSPALVLAEAALVAGTPVDFRIEVQRASEKKISARTPISVLIEDAVGNLVRCLVSVGNVSTDEASTDPAKDDEFKSIADADKADFLNEDYTDPADVKPAGVVVDPALALQIFDRITAKHGKGSPASDALGAMLMIFGIQPYNR
jgi:hypothetical protein